MSNPQVDQKDEKNILNIPPKVNEYAYYDARKKDEGHWVCNRFGVHWSSPENVLYDSWITNQGLIREIGVYVPGCF